jgi:hypothetical protein
VFSQVFADAEAGEDPVDPLHNPGPVRGQVFDESVDLRHQHRHHQDPQQSQAADDEEHPCGEGSPPRPVMTLQPLQKRVGQVGEEDAHHEGRQHAADVPEHDDNGDPQHSARQPVSPGDRLGALIGGDHRSPDVDQLNDDRDQGQQHQRRVQLLDQLHAQSPRSSMGTPAARRPAIPSPAPAP